MISRRLLLGGTAAIALSRISPLPKAAGDIGGSTWGAGLDRLAVDYYSTAVRAGFMTIDEVRRAEDMLPLDLAHLLRKEITS